MDFNRWLTSQLKDRKPADKIGAKECQRCGGCCVRGPCGLDKEDVPKLAKFLNISIQELFDNYLVVDGSDPKFYLRPRRSGQSGGHYLTCSETYEQSACVFFRDGQPGECAIHAAKPKHAQETKCWEENGVEFPIWTKKELKEVGWDGITDEWDPDDR